MGKVIYGPLFIATSNKGKLREIESLVFEYLPHFKEVHGRAAKYAPETENSFKGNAFIKARALLNEITVENPELTSFAVLADDSGMCVDALNGAPGIRSARFAGDHVDDERHIEKVLSELNKKNISPERRTAHYHCALALLIKDKKQVVELGAEGQCPGLIHNRAVGNAGFGYDPIFFSPQFGKTFSELSYDEKNSISHRRNAFEKLKRSFVS